MKPPWKYLARLVSRQRSPEATAESSAPDSDRKLIEIEQRSAATILLPSAERAPGTQQMEGAAPENVVTAPAEIETGAQAPDLRPDFTEAPKANVAPEPEQSYVDPTEPLPVVETAVSLPKLWHVRSKAAKKDRGISSLETPATTTELPFPATSSPVGSFFDNATSLDQEIKQLKELLAKKLLVQNAQLREMLERF